MANPTVLTENTTPAEAGARRERGSDFAELSRRITEAGLLRRRPLYYSVRFTLVGLALAGGVVSFLALGDSWAQLFVAAGLAVVFGQLGLAAHDLAHRQVFSRRRPSEAGGLLTANLLLGMSYGWWMNKHTRHHANPNHEEKDPDVAPDLLVWSRRQAREAVGIPRFIGKHQAVLFFPLLTLEGLNLSFNSFKALRSPSMKRPWLEGTLLLAHFALYFGGLFTVLSPGRALVFLAVHQGLFGIYLGSVFAPNHKGMPMIEEGTRLDFLRRQVLTSRNVDGGVFVDALMGGLNYQIEHHLFPSMPTPALARAQRLTERYCAELGIPYHHTGLLASHREALRHLRGVGEPLRAAR
ncbi:acyl-CoA desaturase [Streptomyces griseoviridis]|jgi:fatty acid desaturase|uniref:Fatty acid desaturase n=3 Tax=Streptomyces TaxID=1883 RepID=A0ABT9L8N4_STRGD|nr:MULTISPECIES: acyl-CoA desaturase [Streptomyces]MDP9680072.1 fatty acid desaturase [Streptomyces griseoviridis]GGS47333.1 delta fatty acid desaturase [Streptomyces niveoruber]GGT05270.1 delta fatty acid desaturase [Streptomyces griseoviridis]GGU66053.1 delta fatty acid desaturase [Streptomyces daghestanicus]GHI29414.1 delta fatty acid desaturase [Streptomyces daghestanicus]